MRYLFALLLPLLYATTGHAAWKAGDSMPMPQCSPQEILMQDTDFRRFFNLSYYSEFYGRGSFYRFAITCLNPRDTNAATIYVVDPQYDAERRVFTSYQVTRVIRADDPVKFIVARRPEDESRTIVEGNSGEPDILLYLRIKTETCPQNAEIMTQELDFRAGRRPIPAEPAQPRASGLCVHLPFGAGTASSIAPANILDYERTAKGGARIVLFNRDSVPQDEELLVLEHTLGSGLQKLSVLKGERIFSRGCGGYLTGARLLPGSSKVALIYRTPKLQIVDYARTEMPPDVVHDFLQLRGGKETFFTCEGGGASYGGDRQRLWITQPQPESKLPAKLHFLGADANYQPLLVSVPL